MMVEDFTGDSAPYSITYDDEKFYQKKNEPIYLDRVQVGNCQIKMCYQEHSLMEFYFITNDHCETFTWELVNGTNSVIDSSHELCEARSIIFYERFILNSVDECLFLRLIDMNDDELMVVKWTIYSVEVNGSSIHNYMTSGGYQKINILGKCHDYFCKRNAFLRFQLLLKLYFEKGIRHVKVFS